MKRFDHVRIKATGEQGIVLRVVESTVEDRFGVLLTTGDDRLNYFTVREIEPLDEPFGIDTRTSSDDVPAAEPSIALPPLHYRHKRLHWVYHDGGGARTWRVYVYWPEKDERDGRGWCDDNAQYWNWPELSKFGWNYAGPAIPPEVGEQPDVPVGAVACEAAEETFDAKTARLEREVVDATLEWASRPQDPVNCGNAKLRILATGIDLKDHLAAAPETDGAMLERLGDDASKWAQEFMKMRGTVETIDEALMTGWFANAIEHSHALRMRGKERVEPTDEALLEFANKRNAAWPEIYGTRTLDDLKIDYLRIALAAFNAPTVEPWSREHIRSLAISYCSAMEGVSGSHDGSERFTFRGARLYEFVYRILAGEKP